MQKVKRIGEFIKKNLKWILLFLCTIIFLDLVEDVFEKEIMKLDIITYNFISTYLISDFVTPIAKIITNLDASDLFSATQSASSFLAECVSVYLAHLFSLLKCSFILLAISVVIPV